MSANDRDLPQSYAAIKRLLTKIQIDEDVLALYHGISKDRDR